MDVGCTEESDTQDCAVCLQKCNFPTKLPCGHVFCFLCVKGVVRQSRKCAMCRAEIPRDFLDHPTLLEKPVDEQPSVEYQWYYEGRNGWWKYDERSNSELETAHEAGETECKLLLAGALYVIDFQNMVQVQSRDQTRRRRVKRDTPTLPAKGIAGIKITSPDLTKTVNETESSPNNSESQDSDVIEVVAGDPEIIEIMDGEDDTYSYSMDSLSQRLSSVDLQEPLSTDNSPTDSPAEENT